MPLGLTVAALVMLSGCPKAPPGPPSPGGEGPLELVTIRSGGDERSFFLGAPPNLGPGPHPLIITAHGGPDVGKLKGMQMGGAWRDHARDGILFAFPNSDYRTGVAWSGPGDADPDRDTRFLRDLVDEVSRRYPVDPDQVYMTGFSAGSGFTWWVYCSDTERYAGFAMLSAPMADKLMPVCEPGAARPVFYMHGDADRRTPMSGNENHDSAQTTWDFLRERNTCEPSPRRVTRDGAEVSAEGDAYTCKDTALELWTVHGGDHCWPTSRSCGGLDASGLILDFWRREAGLPPAR